MCAPQGKLRTQAQVRSELLLVFDMMAALDCAAIRHALQPIRTHLEDLVMPCKQVEAIDAELRALVPPEA